MSRSYPSRTGEWGDRSIRVRYAMRMRMREQMRVAGDDTGSVVVCVC